MFADISGACLENLVSYMYSGILHLTQDTVNVMLLVATRLEISTAIELCENFMSKPLESDISGKKEHDSFKSEDLANEVDGAVEPEVESAVTVEKAATNTGDIAAASKFNISAPVSYGTRSFSRKLQAEEANKSSRQSKSLVAPSCEQAVKNIKGCRKRGSTAVSSMESSPSKRRVANSASEADHDPDWKPYMDGNTCSPAHHYNTRRHSHHPLHKPLLSRNISACIELRGSASSSDGAGAQVTRKYSTKNQNPSSTSVYRLPAWKQSRRILLAARVILAKKMKAMLCSLHCRQCKIEKLSSQSHLAAHILCSHRIRHVCFSCGMHFASFLALIRHSNSHHRYLACAQSAATSTKGICFKARASTVSSLHNKCGWCGQKFESRDLLAEHRETVHRKRSDAPPAPAGRRVVRVWNCSEKDCGEKFKHKEMLRLHMVECHPSVIFTCPLCRFKTQVEHVLKR